MEYLYEQPREKIQHRGASFLTTSELVQAVLGSGTVKVPVAILSRHVSKLLKKGGADYANFIAVEGLGYVKTCQLLAALELGRRWAGREAYSSSPRSNKVPVRNQGTSSVVCIWFDGSGGDAGVTSYPLRIGECTNLRVRRVISDGLKASARRVELHIPAKNRNCIPAGEEVSFLVTLRDTLLYFDISITDVRAFFGQSQVSWKKEFS